MARELDAVGFTGRRRARRTLTLATAARRSRFPRGSIHAVRFRQQSPELAVQWREITSSMASGDMIVMRKTSMRTIEQGENEPRTVTEQALDQLEGTLLEVSDDSVRFEIDGEKVPVRREKLEGLVYYHPASASFAAACAGCSMRPDRPGCFATCSLTAIGSA